MSPPTRGLRERWLRGAIVEINKRRDAVSLDGRLRDGHEKIWRRAEFVEWNYPAELYAFQSRIGENFDDALLREALTDDSCANQEGERDNAKLSQEGVELTVGALEGFLRSAYPFLPEEGVRAFVDYLTQVEVAADAAFYIGTKDLIKSEVLFQLLNTSQ